MNKYKSSHNCDNIAAFTYNSYSMHHCADILRIKHCSTLHGAEGLHFSDIIAHNFVAAMLIGFTQRIRTVSEGQEGAVDLFQLQIIISSLRSVEREHRMDICLLESSTNATVETYISASNMFDATFGRRGNLDDPITQSRDLSPGERTISSPLLTYIRNDFVPEEIECYTIRIFPVDVPGRRELFTCNEDDAGADSYFCEHTICIEDDDDKCYF